MIIVQTEDKLKGRYSLILKKKKKNNMANSIKFYNKKCHILKNVLILKGDLRAIEFLNRG